MKVLEEIRKMMILTWIIPTPETENQWIKKRNFLCGCTCGLIEFAAALSSASYLIKFIDENLEDSLYAFYQVTGSATQVYLCILAFLLRNKFDEMFAILQELYDTYKYLDSNGYMMAANKRGTFLMKLLLKYVLIFWIPYFYALGICSAIFSLIKFGYVDVEKLYVPFKVILPFNQHTYVGWFFETTFGGSAVVSFYIINNSLLSLFGAICFYNQAISKMIKALLNQLDDNDYHSQVEFKEMLAKVLRLHVSAKKLFIHSADLFSLFILIILICNMILLSCAIFHMDLASKHLDISITPMLCAISVSATNLFLYCYFGEKSHEAHADLADIFYAANWTHLPVNLQKYFVLMIQNAQPDLYYHGFGIAYVNLNTFLRMIRTVISYYLMLKKLMGY